MTAEVDALNKSCCPAVKVVTTVLVGEAPFFMEMMMPRRPNLTLLLIPLKATKLKTTRNMLTRSPLKILAGTKS